MQHRKGMKILYQGKNKKERLIYIFMLNILQILKFSTAFN